MMQLEGRHLIQAQAIKIPIHLNMAACQLREGDPHTAIFNCSEVGRIKYQSLSSSLLLLVLSCPILKAGLPTLKAEMPTSEGYQVLVSRQ